MIPAGYLYDNDIVTTVVPGRRHLRLSNGTANVGEGKLYLSGVLPDNGDGTQDVVQRVFQTGGTWYERTAGRFIFHPGHDHIHFENWTQFRVRDLLANDSVGAVRAAGEKTSFCILDLVIHDNSLPNFNPGGEFGSCASTIQGLSVGWVDIYHKELAGQSVDITDLPAGEYWLEAEVDPDNSVLESDESNNITRIKVTIGTPAVINPDRYEPNNTTAEVLARPVGSINSPNLGPCAPVLTVDSLTIHSSSADLFRFYLNDSGKSSDYVRVNFLHSQGDIDMALLDSTGGLLSRSESVSDSERISLALRPEGWYFVRVYGFSGALSPYYRLTIDPPSNNPPSITTLTPPAGNTNIPYGLLSYRVDWTYSDPESDHCWVSVFVNSAPLFDGNETLLTTSLQTDAANGFYLINSSGLLQAQYWVYCQITDGGSVSGNWSAGTVTFVDNSLSSAIVGTLVDTAGNPVEGAIATLTSPALADTSDALGSFLIPQLPHATYQLTVSHPDFLDTLVSSVAVSPPDSTFLTITLQKRPSALSVTVLQGHDSLPLPMAIVTHGFFADTSNSLGIAMLEQLQSGMALVAVAHPDYFPDTISAVLTPGDTTAAEMYLLPRPAQLSGLVTNPEGAPLAGALVMLDGIDTVFTDSLGQYRIGINWPGDHQLHFRAYAHADSIVQVVTLPNEQLAIDLQMRFVCTYLPGDLTDDARVDIADLTTLIDYLFVSNTVPPNPLAANVDGSASGLIDISDVTALVAYLFLSGPSPACWLP